MNRLLAIPADPSCNSKSRSWLHVGAVSLVCLASAWAAGCSSDTKPAASSSVGGSTGAGGSDAGGTSTAGGSDAGAVCATAPADADVSAHTIDPTDTEHLSYMGRIDDSDPAKPKFWAPGVVISARFTGTSVTVKLQDSFKGQNYYEVVIDRDPKQTFIFQPKTSTTSYVAFTNLCFGEHLVEFAKRTETSGGSAVFLGFEVGGVPLPAPAQPTRKIEVIGDSITAGSGVEPGQDQVNCNSGNASANAYLSYGAVLGRNLDAQYVITAAGGRGVMENYECGSADTLPAGYDHWDQRDLTSGLWDHTKYVPDAVIIGLGTNDFSPDSCNKPPISEACDPNKFNKLIDTFEAFVTKLRGYYPNAHIFITSSPMLADGWPTPVAVGDAGATCAYTSRTSQIQAITAVVEHFNVVAGDAKVHLITSIPKGLGRGCGTHPNTSEHAEIGGTPDNFNPKAADMLLNPVKTIMGW